MSQARAWSTRLAKGASRLKPPTVAWPFLQISPREMGSFHDDIHDSMGGEKHMISRIYIVHMDDLVRLLQNHDLLEETCGFPEKNDSSRLIQ